MFEQEALVDSEYAEARDKLRATVAPVYDLNYRSFSELYGSSNDEAGDPDESGGELLHFPPMNTGSRPPLPFVPPTEFDPETDRFPGLDPPKV